MNVPTVITPPAAEPITLPEAKAHLRVIGTDDDTQIELMITAARQLCEEYLQRSIMPQTLQVTLDEFGCGVRLPWPPFAEFVSLGYTDAEGTPGSVAAEAMIVDFRSGLAELRPVYGTSWPSVQPGSQITAQYKAGYLDAASVPAPIKAWMLLLIGTLYENRESVVVGTGINAADLPGGIWDRLVQPYRVYL